MREVVRNHVSRRAFLLFLSFVWLALVYIVVAFTDITAQMFIGAIDLKTGTRSVQWKPLGKLRPVAPSLVLSGGIATSSLIYLVLPMIMGLVVRTGRLSWTRQPGSFFRWSRLRSGSDSTFP